MDQQPGQTKFVSITEFLTPAQIKEVMHLKTAKPICDSVIRPNIAEINRKLGQENDPMYLAYMVEYVLSQMPPL